MLAELMWRLVHGAAFMLPAVQLVSPSVAIECCVRALVLRLFDQLVVSRYAKDLDQAQ